MSNGYQVPKKCANPLATARLDRESAGQGDSGSPEQAKLQYRLATILQVPVGYEDDTGFHCGQPQIEEIRPETQSGNTFSNPYPI
jgi:hypothetical protein